MDVPDLPDTNLPALALPALVLRHAASHGDQTAIRQKRGAEWIDLSWSEYAERVRACAAGVLALGFEAPLHLAIFAENSIEWVIGQMAAGLLGGCTFGCYPTSSLNDLEYALGEADAQIVLCGDWASAEKVEAIRHRLPRLRWIILLEGCIPDSAARDHMMTLGELEAMGSRSLRQAPALLDGYAEALPLDQAGLIVFTSGSTGPPKPAMLTYRNMRAAAMGFGPILGFGPNAVVLSYLPLCHIAEQAMTNFAALYFRSTVAFGSGLPTLIDDLRVVRPTYFSGVPRVWLRLQAHIRAHFADAGRADTLAEAVAAGSPAAFGAQDAIPENAAYAAVMAEAKALVGLDRAGAATSGAASLPAEVLTFFRALGFNLLELYGQTESCSVMTLHRPGRVVPGTVGEPIPTIDLVVAGDGEVLVRGESVFAGYYKNAEATAQTIVDGWLHTGDVGRIEDGQLRIVDRKKDIMITDGGKNISPAEIEALMRSSDLIQECVLVAEGRKFVAALIQIDPSGFPGEMTGRPYSSLSADGMAQGLVAAEIRRLNQTLPRVSQIKRFFILQRPLAAAEGELTPTLKLRRFIVHQNHAAEIEALYAGDVGCDVYPKNS